LLREALQCAEIEVLIRKPQHAVPAEREKDLPQIALAQRLRQIDPARRCAEHRFRRLDSQHHPPLAR
jgi:hypothetical protein